MRIVFFLSILTSGAVALLPNSSIHDPSPFTRNQTLCTPETCGDGCNYTSGQLSEASGNSKIPLDFYTTTGTNLTDGLQRHVHGLRKRTLEPISRIADTHEYIRNLSRYISRKASWVPSPHRVNRLLRRDAPFKKAFRFPSSGDDAFGVGNLFGCTAVMIVSSRGVVLSHIWEVPDFVDARGVDQTPDSFLSRISEFLRGSDEDSAGFDVLKRPYEILSQQYNPEVFLVTPYTSDEERMHGMHTILRYQGSIIRLSDWLWSHFPSGMPRIVGYTRRNRSEVTLDNRKVTSRTPWRGVGARAIVEVDMNGTNVICTDGTRVLPDICLREWRLWVEDTLIETRRFILPEN